jgi:hypothetical protein
LSALPELSGQSFLGALRVSAVKSTIISMRPKHATEIDFLCLPRFSAYIS